MTGAKIARPDDGDRPGHTGHSWQLVLPLVLCPALLAPSLAAQASEVSQYDCGGRGFSARVEVIPEEGRAKITLGDGTYSATARRGGAFANTQRQIQFFPQGKPRLYLGVEQFSCRIMRAQVNQPPRPGGPVRFDSTYGKSLGGKLRAGPGTNFPQKGSLREGQEVEIIRNTGVRFDGYDWFEIRALRSSGFQWGGIMCSDDPRVKGVYGKCSR